jgi:membrane associated rhomboid family serine protease
MIPLRDSQPSRTVPVVTIALIAINAAIWFYEVSLDDYSRNYFLSRFALVPARFELPTLVTSMFLHGSWLHVIGNLWFLWIFGDNIEDILGRGKYLLFYLLCGAIAGAAHMAFSPESRAPTVGASGAIAGVMGAYLVRFPHSRIVTLVPIFVFFTTLELPAWMMLIYWFLLQVFGGVGQLSMAGRDAGGIAWLAHVGGFVAGIALIYLLPTQSRYRRYSEYRW